MMMMTKLCAETTTELLRNPLLSAVPEVYKYPFQHD